MTFSYRFGRRKWLVSILLLMLLAGCDTKAWLEKITPQEDDALARSMIVALLREDYAFVLAHMDKCTVGDTPEATVRELYEYLDRDPVRSVELIGCSVFTSKAQRRSRLSYQLEFPRSWYAADLTIDRAAGVSKVIGFHLQVLPNSLDEIHRFTLHGRTVRHYAILLNAIGVPVFIVYTLIQCIRTHVRRKWLWILFILVGVGAISLNWTTGQVGVKLLAVHLVGASVFRSGPYAPWVVSVSFPLGAFLFLLKRRKLRRATPSSGDAEVSDTGADDDANEHRPDMPCEANDS